MPKYTDVGPDMTVVNCTEATYMGAEVKFSVDINDKDFALSTLKAKLLYDETEVNSLTIRTKENGTYEGSILAPLYANEVNEGIATVVFASQNVGMGLSYDTVYVSLRRPDFAALTLKTEEGNEYELAKVGEGYKYELKAQFPEKVKGHLVTPAINEEGDVITFVSEGVYVTHRIVENRFVEGELVTKGDANEKEDANPIAYANVVGTVKAHFPVLGKFLVVVSTGLGKFYLVLAAVCGVLFLILGNMLKKKKE